MDRVFVRKLIERAHEQLHERMQNNKLAGLAISPVVKVSNVFKLVGESIADEKVDLTVMGTKGASGLHEILVGSNTEKVVRYAKCPVLSVREKSAGFSLKNVVLAVNFEENYTAFLNRLKEWQHLFGFTLHLVHVNTPLNFDTTANIDEKMLKFGKKHHLQGYTFTIINDYSYETGIIKFATKTKADMIVMLTHGRKGLSFFLDGSVTSSVVNHANIPVMSYKITT
jgi:nucleotide-binding universal stress UspA family protein